MPFAIYEYALHIKLCVHSYRKYNHRSLKMWENPDKIHFVHNVHDMINYFSSRQDYDDDDDDERGWLNIYEIK